jgi:two-component system, NtrC family, nitrogen regulation response regulator NtrX
VNAALKHAETLPKTEMNLASFGKSLVVNELKLRLEQLSRTKNSLLLIGKKGGSVELCARFLHVVGTPWTGLKDYEKLATAPLEILDVSREGVIFVDEVTALNKTEQKGLMLMLSKADKYQVRVVCASTFSVPQLVENAQFDSGLLQMLSTSTLKIPSLNDHREDIPDLASAMATLLVETTGAQYKSFDVAALNALRNADWVGDLQQLEAVVENAMLTSLTEKITLEDVTRVLDQFTATPESIASKLEALPINLIQPLREARDEFERFYFKHHMSTINNNMSKLAEISGLERTHLYRKLKQLGIKIKG